VGELAKASAAEFEPPRPIKQTDDLTSFDCGKPELDTWLRERAWRSEQSRDARTYIVTRNELVVGFYSLSATAVDRQTLSGWMSRNAPRPVPAILLARLAVDRSQQGTGLGFALLADAIRRSTAAAEYIGARALIVVVLGSGCLAFRRGQTRQLAGRSVGPQISVGCELLGGLVRRRRGIPLLA